MSDNLTKWRSSLTEEERQAHYKRIAESRRRKREQSVSPPPAPPGASTESALAAEFLPLFRSLLGQFVDRTAGMTALGLPQFDYCRMCSGGGIHSIGCGCVCHKARAALAAYDNARTDAKPA